MVYYAQNNYPEALKNYVASLKISEEIGDKQDIVNTYNNIGNVYFVQGNYPEALKYYSASLKICEEIGDKERIAYAYGSVGNVYHDQGNYPEALKNYFASLKICEEIENKRGIAITYNNVGKVYHAQGNDPEALKNHFASLKIKEEIGDKQGIANSYNDIGHLYLNQDNYPEALKNYFAALKIMEEIGDKRGIAKVYNGMGLIYGYQGNYPEAMKNISASLEISKEIGDKKEVASAYGNIGDVYSDQGNFPDALKEYLRALQLAEEIGFKSLIEESCFNLTDTCKALHDYETALQYYERYHEVDKELLGEESSKQLNNLKFMHNLEQKEKDLEIEQLRNVELKKERDRSEALLLNILPAEVAEELKAKGSADAKQFDTVTVMFTDFKGFTQISERLTPTELVAEIDYCFKAFDHIITRLNIEKIKTIGDAYMCVGGLPVSNTTHATDVVEAAIEIQQFMLNHLQQRTSEGKEVFEIRIGIHTGPVVAGIVGIKKFAYDIWGDTVNIASRMESSGEAGKINISGSTYELVKDTFACTYRGKIQAKNKGEIDMYFVDQQFKI
jgi:class 3 adenylate cyclase/predicted negative regulator of RcsB-dependent stress response